MLQQGLQANQSDNRRCSLYTFFFCVLLVAVCYANSVTNAFILDDVLIPWEDVLFYQHTRAAAFIRQTLHRYSAFPFVQRTLSFADLMIGAALWNVRQTGLEKQQPVQEKK